MILCDTCPKSFCARCIECSLGKAELRRIQGLSDRWHCFICSPQPIEDLCIKNGWKFHPQLLVTKKSNRKGVIYDDISRGREKFEIPVVNEVDGALPPLDFTYVTEYVAGENVSLSNNPSHMSCCTCTDNCKDPTRCECALRMGGTFAYDANGVKVMDIADGVYECNSRCACNVNRCKNRVVGKGPHLRLEVFRCDNPLKGWGVRCKTDIYPGTYITDYLGELLREKDSETRGMEVNDEYLFTMDFFGRSCANQRLADLGMSASVASLPRQLDLDATVLGREEVSQFLEDDELVELLTSKGAISRALEMGRGLRRDPVAYIQQLDREFNQEETEEATSAGAAAAGAGKSSSSGSAGKGKEDKSKGKKSSNGKGSPIDLDKDDISRYLSDSDNDGSGYGDAEGEGEMKQQRGNSNGKGRIKAKLSSNNNTKANRKRAASNLSDAAGNTKVGKGKNISEDSAAGAVQYRSWVDFHAVARQKALEQAKSIILDRTVLEIEENNQTYTVDGR